MIITFLGACANQISNRESVSFLIEEKDTNLLVDCGPGIVSALGKCNKKASDVNNLLITHVHGDHISGFPYFVWNRNFERMGKDPAQDLNVYGTKDVIELAKFTFERCYPELKLPFEINYHIVDDDKEVRTSISAFDLVFVPASHTVPCLSCVVSSGNKKIVYTSDSLFNEKLVDHSQKANLVIHEGMMPCAMASLAEKVKHSMAFEAGIFANKVLSDQLLLVHIAPSIIGNESVLLNEARKYFSGPISIPCEGTVYVV